VKVKTTSRSLWELSSARARRPSVNVSEQARAALPQEVKELGAEHHQGRNADR